MFSDRNETPKIIWECPKCKKVFTPQPRKIRNVIYFPDSVTHKHGRINYQCQAILPHMKGY